MKKTIIIPLTAVMVITGCNGHSGNQASGDPNEASDTFMLDGSSMEYNPTEHDSLMHEYAIQSMKESLTERVNEIYAEVNRRYDPDYISKKSERSLEAMFTTEEWQAAYNAVFDIQRRLAEKNASDEGHLFQEGATVWNMGSFDTPFTPNIEDIKVPGDGTAEVRFYLSPAESEGCTVIWKLVLLDGEWRINNFIDTGIYPTDEGEHAQPTDYLQLMNEYIKENR